jgi:hypothetical protein
MKNALTVTVGGTHSVRSNSEDILDDFLASAELCNDFFVCQSSEGRVTPVCTEFDVRPYTYSVWRMSGNEITREPTTKKVDLRLYLGVKRRTVIISQTPVQCSRTFGYISATITSPPAQTSTWIYRWLRPYYLPNR